MASGGGGNDSWPTLLRAFLTKSCALHTVFQLLQLLTGLCWHNTLGAFFNHCVFEAKLLLILGHYNIGFESKVLPGTLTLEIQQVYSSGNQMPLDKLGTT